MNTKFKKIILFIAIDIIGYTIGMGIFLLFFYLIPYELHADGSVVGDSEELATFDFVSEKNRSDISSHGFNRNSGKSSANRSNTDTEDITYDDEEVQKVLSSDISYEILETYTGENSKITITKKYYGSGSDKVTYYVADVYVRNLQCLKTAFAKDTYGTNIKEDALDIAGKCQSVLAITGDSYGNNDTGIVVRNGVLYRTDENEADVCILFSDGTMKTYTADEFDAEAILAEGVWQAWCFGPGLLDGNGHILSEFQSTGYLSGNHPRVAIGYVEPGHFVFTVVDGRNEGYSRGVSLSELAAIMKLENCIYAYNLDGGGSSSMVYNGKYVNDSTSRDITDIIYITD